jgi:hypothetical protein
MPETPEIEIEYDFTKLAEPVEKTIHITIAVSIDGELRTFRACATTANDAYFVAGGLLSGLDNEADLWLIREGRIRRDGN